MSDQKNVNPQSVLTAKDSPFLAVSAPEGQTDHANARRLIKLHRDKLRYCHPWRTWLVWDGSRWKPDDNGEVTRLSLSLADQVWTEARQSGDPGALRFAARTAGEKSVSATLALASALVPIQPADLDANSWLLNCPNGTLDLSSGELLPHRREDCITKLCPTEYAPNAKSETWERFLASIFGGDRETIAFVQRWFGYCLTGDVREQVLPIFHGTGSNGKSTLLTAFTETVGTDYAMKAVPDLLLSKKHESHPTERADLFGRRFVACVETGDGRRLNETLVKELTGGDRIRARRMKKDFFEFAPTHKAILCTNHRPDVRGTDHAIWRRIRLVPFAVQFWDEDKGETGPAALRQDKGLKDRLDAEAQGILAWAVRGCLDWQKRGGLGDPPAVHAATAEYRASEDVLQQFLDACCNVDPTSRTKSSELYDVYAKWCAESGEIAMSQKKLANSLSDRGYQNRKSGGVKVWNGIGI